MKTILKYNIPGPDSTFDAPSDSRPLCVQADLKTQQPALYLLCDPDLPKIKIQVQIFATGQLIREVLPGQWVGTVQLMERGRVAVLHVFWKQVPIQLAS